MRPFSPPWKDPLSSSAPGLVRKSSAGLRARVLGQGPPDVIFLHGLGASLRYWGCAYDELGTSGRLIFIDLLGFGGSDKPRGTYEIDRHLAALADTLDEMQVERSTLVGHSTGGLIAMALAGAYPERVQNVLAFGAPVFPSLVAARDHLRSLGFMARLIVDASPLAPRMCQVMCDYRSIARRIAPLLAPRLPCPVAADGVDHIWDSYSGTFNAVLSRNQAREWATRLGNRLRLVYGDADCTCPPQTAMRTPGNRSSGRIHVIKGGDHHLPLRRPNLCSNYLKGMLVGRALDA